MRRRDFLTLAGAAAAFPRLAFAQQAAKVPRVAFVSLPLIRQYTDAWTQGLADNGYVNGKTMVMDVYTPPSTNDLADYAARAVSSRPDIILTHGATPAVALKALTNTIPIVFGAVGDPVGVGLTNSLAHPSGNFTGTTLLAPDLVGKQLEILKEIIPALKRFVALNQAGGVLTALAQVPVTADALGLEAVVVDFVDTQDLTAQFGRVLAAASQAVYVPASVYFTSNRTLLAELEIENRLPFLTSGVTDGAQPPFYGLVAYGPNTIEIIHRATSFASAILRGAKPSELPVELPNTFDFAVNTWVARLLGITIPSTILAEATLVADYDPRAPQGPAK